MFVFSVILETNVMVVKKDFVVFEKGIKDVGKIIWVIADFWSLFSNFWRQFNSIKEGFCLFLKGINCVGKHLCGIAGFQGFVVGLSGNFWKEFKEGTGEFKVRKVLNFLFFVFKIFYFKISFSINLIFILFISRFIRFLVIHYYICNKKVKIKW